MMCGSRSSWRRSPPGGGRCARLVTTRVPGLLAGRDVAVRVDQMSAGQARRLLTAGLPPISPELAGELLAVTGRWPLLLRLVNKILVNTESTGADVSAAGAELLERLRVGGPAVIDELTGEASRGLQVGQPAERARAVRATIMASTSLLEPQDEQRFAELGVFAEDETIPFSLVARLWRASAGLDDLQVSQLCARLGELALVSAAAAGSGGLVLHDVVRDFLRGELGPPRLAAPERHPAGRGRSRPARRQYPGYRGRRDRAGGVVGSEPRGPVPVGSPDRAPVGRRPTP